MESEDVNAVVDLNLLARIARHHQARPLLAMLADSFMAPRRTLPVAQLAFRFNLPAPEKGALLESDLVRCDHYASTIPARTCIARQAAKWPGKKAALYGYCGSGECGQGAGYARRATWDPRAVWSRGRFSFYRPGSKEQHTARKRLGAEGGLDRRAAEWTDSAELVMIGHGAVTARARRDT
jgi:hypothetical protein